MGISRTEKFENKLFPEVSYTLISPSEETLEENVNLGNHWSKSWYDNGGNTRRKGELFHVGAGTIYVTENEFERDYGTYSLIPNNDFIARVDMWGAGGGEYDTTDSQSRAGGGGYTSGLVYFEKNRTYALTIGQAGRRANSAGNYTPTHAGGGGGSHRGGQGGGLTGIFFENSHRGRAIWNHNPPFEQRDALLIAGGGGGAGHHNTTTHHGSAGGGGGWKARPAHNSSGGSQYYGGYYNSYQSRDLASGHQLHGGRASTQNTWCGGGGGGWWGGGGGAHSSNHYNGGSGGSGHHAMRDIGDNFPNSDLAKYVLHAHTETSPSSHNSPWRYSGAFKNPLAYRSVNPPYNESSGQYAGKAGYGTSSLSGTDNTSGARHGKIVITLQPQLLPTDYFANKGVTQPQGSEWVNQDAY
jgi:hypothetical protein